MSDTFAHVSIRILGKEYQVACPVQEKADLLAAADLLNKKMQDIRDSGKVVGADRIAVMAALNMAHQIIDGSIGDTDHPDSIDTRIRALNNRIEKTLAEE